MPWYYRPDGRWIEVPYGDEAVQVIGEYASDDRFLYQLLTHDRYEKLKAWLQGRDGKEADRLRKLVEVYEGQPTQAENGTEA